MSSAHMGSTFASEIGAYGVPHAYVTRIGNKRLQNSYNLVTNSYKVVTKWLQSGYKLVTKCHFLPKKLQNSNKTVTKWLQFDDKVVTFSENTQKNGGFWEKNLLKMTMQFYLTKIRECDIMEISALASAYRPVKSSRFIGKSDFKPLYA